ncbi:PREDICTED: aspartic and glutamic acid-rich protein-like [Dinoponera quadriceps]|uniref:Aspartic and glutamic acid-rich protein-like n=1 Tax=Dinoponera quadriceps TaxID=609295 RepID=A0A6P3XFT1_DINQU|nr:PREDICTED: aspartic and glutamic acid-rich protein-like [Dinoponera quadriceps]
MRNRSDDYTCIFTLILLLEMSLTPICHAKISNDTRRTQEEMSVRAAASEPREEDAKYDMKEVQEVSLRREKNDGELEGSDTRVRQKRAESSSNLADFQRSNVGKSSIDDSAADVDSRASNGKAEDYAEEEADDEMTRRREGDEDEGTSDLVLRLPREANLKYTDRDEGSSLYDDYEAKDVAKRGAEDYEEVEEDSPGTSEDVAAMREEESDEAGKRETRGDARVKRNRAAPESLADDVKSSASGSSNPEETRSDGSASELRLEPGSPEESKIAEVEPREISDVELSRGLDELPGASEKLAGGSTSNEAVSRSVSAEDSNAEYEKRAEERIQRKIDSLKEEIRRDVEAQRRVQDIRENNARFDELWDDESRAFEDGSVEKLRRNVIKKRSTRGVGPAAKSAGKKRPPKREEREKPQRRSDETGKSDSGSKKRSSSGNPKRRSVGDRDGSSGPSKGFFKKKRERARETILVKNDHLRAKKRRSRSYSSPSEPINGKSGNEISADRDSNSHLRANFDGKAPLANEDDANEEEQSPAGRADPLVSFMGSSQELSPRLAREYKEAFGGLQSDSGNALARFKRIKRVLDGPDAKI